MLQALGNRGSLSSGPTSGPSAGPLQASVSGQAVLAAADPGPEAQRNPQVLGLSVHVVNALDQPGAQQLRLRVQKPLEEEGVGPGGKSV